MSGLEILQTELTDDPLARGYSGMSDRDAAQSLNVLDRTRTRDRVSSWEVLAAIRPADFLLVTDAAHQRYLSLLFSVEQVPLGETGIRTALTAIFSGATGTLANLGALEDEAISRATELGLGTVREGHVIHARLP